MNKKNQTAWSAVLLILLIINLSIFIPAILALFTSLYGGFVLLGLPFYLALIIIDLVVASFHFKERSNYIWKAIRIILLLVILLPFWWYGLGWLITGQFAITGLLFETPYLLFAYLLIGLIAIQAYIIQRHPNRFSTKAKGAIYTILIALSLIALAIIFNPYWWVNK